MLLNLPLIELILPLVFIFLGIIGGFVFEKIILKRLTDFATRSRFRFYEIVFVSLRSVSLIVFFVAGFYGAILVRSINPVLDQILKNLLIVVFLYAVTLFLARVAAAFITILVQKIDGLPASLISNLTRIIIFVFGSLMILQTLGIAIAPILTTLGIGGLAVALALQDTLSNLFSGIYLTISGQVRTGNYLKLESGQEGYVVDVNWRNTTIREIPDNLVIIPNSKLAAAIFTNYHLPVKEITLTIAVGVSYESDLEKVEKVTVEVAKEVMQAVNSESKVEPFILFEEFNDSSIDFKVYLRVSEFLSQRLARHEFIKRLHQRYNEEGIVIPFPIREVRMK
ncbi:MAG: mechanosensitive ion channel family protein [Oscillatoria sp. PMC 1068.18]|nr:mechanosensitive ion channel family protein [Oscillatoria sp. PMC 1076.18]MEC4990640.1 mechanosensitive ion channel family protein [Oscillatoria sp. PMC 1068.18]